VHRLASWKPLRLLADNLVGADRKRHPAPGGRCGLRDGPYEKRWLIRLPPRLKIISFTMLPKLVSTWRADGRDAGMIAFDASPSGH
jgi:hypothetical protein